MFDIQVSMRRAFANSVCALRRLTSLVVLGAGMTMGANALAQCNFDVDDNGKVDALTDGILILRHGFGISGQSLTLGALGTGAMRTDPTAIATFINANKTAYDLDGNGTFDALTDGLLIIRSIFGLSGSTVTTGAIGNLATRNDWNAVSAYLSNGCTAITATAAQLKDAARLLSQTTWGPTYSEINALAVSPAPQADNWITQQFALPIVGHVAGLDAKVLAGTAISRNDTWDSFWTQALTGPDQLRQRVAYALSQIIVMSDDKDSLVNSPHASAGYYDVLSRNAFGNFRTLLDEVTKNPGMAVYLDMMCNEKESVNPPRVPNENYAREVLQLFSIGTLWLNQDGTLMKDGQNQPIPTYDETVVQGFAKVFTGWSYNKGSFCSYPNLNINWVDPMIAFNAKHSVTSKTLLALTPNGANVVLPAQQVANAQADLTAALDNIFNHPNVGPYIGMQLIKFLVTSNPSPAYVSRVSAAFANNGQGIRGDMKAVIRAILLDTEARDATFALGDTYGKLREPVMRFGNLLRTFHATAPSGRIHISSLADGQFGMNQQPLSSPTVFNFYSFDFSPQGALSGHNLLGPEFEIVTSTSIITHSNNNLGVIQGGWNSGSDKLSLDYAALAPLASSPQQMVDYLNLVMCNGSMTPATTTQLLSLIALIPQSGNTWQSDRWKTAIWVVFNSPEYVIQR